MADKTDFTPELTLTPNLDAAAAAEAAAEKRKIKGPPHFNLVRRPFYRNMRVQRTSTGRRGGRPLRRVT